MNSEQAPQGGAAQAAPRPAPPPAPKPVAPQPPAERSLGEALFREGLITEAQLKHALDFQRQTGGDIRDILPKLGYIREHVLVQYIARTKHMHFVDPEAAEVDDELMAKIPREVIEKHQIVPLRSEQHGLLLALSDPDDFAAIDEIQFLTNRPIESALAPKAAIRKAINQYYQRDEARKKRAAALQGAPGAGGAHIQKVLALPADALLKGLVLALIEKGQVEAESILAYASLGASARR
jgi:hypothetical protein